MRQFPLTAVLLLTIMSLGTMSLGPLGHAARDKAAVATSSLELIVFEVDGCDYCEVFRRDVLPQYKAAPVATRAPIRFVDINKVEIEKMSLRGSVTSVPTVVLMQDGREFDRITGYVGPSNFFHMIVYMLDRID